MKPEQTTGWSEREIQPLIGEGKDFQDSDTRERKFLYEEMLWEDLLRMAIDSFSTVESLQLREFLERLEKGIIIRTLSRVDGNLKEAAKILGVKYTTLHEKLKRHSIRLRRDAY
jgi:DNA-binding NtrC family response regulator